MKRSLFLPSTSVLTLILTLFLLLISARTASQEAMASRIAPDILRFHVLAASNSSKDQTLKLGVRDTILSVIQSSAPKNASKPQLERWIAQHRSHLRCGKLAFLSGRPGSRIPFPDPRLFSHQNLRPGLLPLRCV